MLVLSWFFWPTPAVALVGAVFLPVAMRAGLPAIGVAVALNLFGHGLALSTDFVILFQSVKFFFFSNKKRFPKRFNRQISR